MLEREICLSRVHTLAYSQISQTKAVSISAQTTPRSQRLHHLLLSRDFRINRTQHSALPCAVILYKVHAIDTSKTYSQGKTHGTPMNEEKKISIDPQYCTI